MRLIDADKAKEKLRSNAQNDGSPFVGVIVEVFCEFLDQAPTVEDAEDHGEIGCVPRWIPVTERLPDKEEFVLVVVNGRWHNIKFVNAAQIAMYDEDGWWIDAYPEWKNPKVSHWMPLPEPLEVNDHA